MVVLAKEVVQRFCRGLITTKSRSGFDTAFLERVPFTSSAASQELLQNPLVQSLYDYDSDQWIALFAERLKELWLSEYDWTKIGLGSYPGWLKSKTHVNYHWYHLALKIAEVTGKHVTEIIFAGVEIAEKDRPYLNTLKEFSSLIYTNDFQRLVILNRMIKVAEARVCTFANYDSNADEYPVSLTELSQIRTKLSFNNYCYKPIVIANWNEFRDRYYSVWGAQSAPEHFENLLYPLHRIVVNYFAELSGASLAGSTRNLLDNLYKEELADLSVNEANYFYGQCIVRQDTRVDSTFLLDILLNLREATNDLSMVLSSMVQLAIWITHENPAMLISHPDVNQVYYIQQLGPYLNQRLLASELTKLLRYRRELSDNDFVLIEQLKVELLADEEANVVSADVVSGPLSEDALFQKIMNIYVSRADYNRTETFLDITKIGIISGSYQYIHHQTGANSQYIRLARLLQACGFLKRHGIEDYFQLLMPSTPDSPGLASPFDAVTGDYLSAHPLSHYTLPEKDQTYLIYLGNSLDFQISQQKFYNINTAKAGPLTPKEFDCVDLYAAKKFRKYPRIPKFTHYRLHATTLQALVDLVNDSLNFDATQDGDGYTLREGFSQCWTMIPDRVVEYEIVDYGISYQIRDSWNRERIHIDSIVFKNRAENRSFNNSLPAQRLMFILHVAMHKGQARCNVSISQYYKAYVGYVRFRQFYLTLDSRERTRLDMVSMRFAASVRTFGEVFNGGFPHCMAAASKWFSTLILDYLPELKFRHELEGNKKYKEYLSCARRDSQHLYLNWIENDLTDSMSDLVQLLTHESSRIGSFSGLRAKGMELLGVTEEPILKQATTRLLSIADTVTIPLNQFSMFGSQQNRYLATETKGNISGNTSDDSGSFDSVFGDKTPYSLDESDYSSVSSKSSRAQSPHKRLLDSDAEEGETDSEREYISINSYA